MVRSFECRYVGCSAPMLILTALMVMHPLAAAASPPAQGQDVAAALRQLDALDRLIQNSETSTVVAPGQRYYLDYSRLRADVARVRVGLQDYLTPPRAQPRDPVEIVGQYRAEQAEGQPGDTDSSP
ncbi:RAQPRD family integrative conjugative element protein [Xanthomonas hortorum]|uniref:integrative conjugative element protein, RAQPRD family n=1 Tax=Xanthomonas hortorum TaxID=56454 RepID=UPI0029357E36|nr:RAQPRD family integrative conjugative element protein [Xanthomonas hortorum]MDV2449555.1 RAQPRD family integrative conjugative element protein [Xanthomonas hortorum NBC5720]